uniref:Uncharacterized protein n=1 Tax=Arundo donax TaxID=35708 RepID=A0A0A8ZTD4_ARUDO
MTKHSTKKSKFLLIAVLDNTECARETIMTTRYDTLDRHTRTALITATEEKVTIQIGYPLFIVHGIGIYANSSIARSISANAMRDIITLTSPPDETQETDPKQNDPPSHPSAHGRRS